MKAFRHVLPVIAGMVFWVAPCFAEIGRPASGMDALKELYRRPEAIPFPASNPYSPAKEALGKALFFDPILSGSRTVACANCHNPGLSWGDGLPLANGIGPMRLHTPTLIDIAWVPVQLPVSR